MNAPVKPPAAGNGAGRKRRPREDAEGPPGRSGGARRGARAARRQAAPARPADRASASHPGPLRPSLRRASRGARAGDEAGADRSVRGRDLLRAFRRREGRRDPSPAGHGARVRLALLRDGGRGETARATCPAKLGPGVRVVRAPCMGACDRAPVCAVGHVQVMQADSESVATAARKSAHAHPHKPEIDLAAYRAAGGYTLLGDCLSGKHTRETIIKGVDDAGLRGLGGAGFPTGPQMDPGAAGRRPAPDGGERRRRRARHVQGSVLSRPRSAPLHRRHADRRLGGRGGRHLRLHPRRISRADRDAARGIRARRRSRPDAARHASICAAAPAPTSAAKNPR